MKCWHRGETEAFLYVMSMAIDKYIPDSVQKGGGFEFCFPGK